MTMIQHISAAPSEKQDVLSQSQVLWKSGCGRENVGEMIRGVKMQLCVEEP